MQKFFLKKIACAFLMRQLFTFIFFLSAFFAFRFFPDSLFQISKEAQTACANRLSSQSKISQDFNAALACGVAPDSSAPWRSLLTDLGLYHTLVVSLSHLLLLEWLVSKRSSLLFWLLGFGMLISTGLQPPLLRGVVQRLFLKPYMGPFQVIGSYWICILLVPQWLNSASLTLSCLTSLALTLQLPGRLNPLIHFSIHASLPWLLSFLIIPIESGIHPVQLFANLLLGPLFSVVLIPLSWFHWIFSDLNLAPIHQLLFDFLSHFRFDPAGFSTSISRSNLKFQALSAIQQSGMIFSVFLTAHLWNGWFLRKRIRFSIASTAQRERL